MDATNATYLLVIDRGYRAFQYLVGIFLVGILQRFGIGQLPVAYSIVSKPTEIQSPSPSKEAAKLHLPSSDSTYQAAALFYKNSGV
jgi:hypothetical protein